MNFLAITWDVNPEMISLGPLHVRYYGLLFVGGLIVSYWLFLKMFKREKLPVQLLDKLTVIVGVSLVVGARLGHCLFYQPEYFLHHPLEIILPVRFSPHFEFTGYQGLASHGAAIGILIGLWWFCRKYKKNYMWILDRIAIVIPLAGAMVRLGNLMNSEVYGVKTSLPWGFIFVRAGETMPHHATQLYEAFSYLILFCIIWFLYKKKLSSLYRGTLFGMFLIILFTARFLIEYVKEPQVAFEAEMYLNMGQLLSIPFIIAGIFVLLWSFKKKTPAEKQQ
jgi:prolipoprotein diacylglyceryl transferase